MPPLPWEKIVVADSSVLRLIRACWAFEPVARPTFTQVVASLTEARRAVRLFPGLYLPLSSADATRVCRCYNSTWTLSWQRLGRKAISSPCGRTGQPGLTTLTCTP